MYRCPLSYRVSTTRRNFCPSGHVQPRNRYAEEKISMIIGDADGRRRCHDTKLKVLNAGHNGAERAISFSEHPRQCVGDARRKPFDGQLNPHTLDTHPVSVCYTYTINIPLDPNVLTLYRLSIRSHPP